MTAQNTDIPRGFYSAWNMEDWTRKKLDEYSLLRCSYSELRRLIYKAFTQRLDNVGNVVHEYDLFLLYKGKLFTTVWQNDSFAAYVLPEKFMRGGKPEPQFIISIREFQGERIAIIQRMHKSTDA